MNRHFWQKALAGLVAVGLTGCGGDDADPQAAVSMFPLQGAMKARMQAGATEELHRLRGVQRHRQGRHQPGCRVAAFEGAAVQSVPQATTYHFSNCVPVTSVVAGAAYYDTDLALLGDMTSGQEYSKVTSVAVPVPLLVAVGEELEYARLTVYADSSKASVKGRRVQSYKVAADGPRSAFVTFTAKAYDVSDALLYTESVKIPHHGRAPDGDGRYRGAVRHRRGRALRLHARAPDPPGPARGIRRRGRTAALRRCPISGAGPARVSNSASQHARPLRVGAGPFDVPLERHQALPAD
jgi:hypothetical protein